MCTSACLQSLVASPVEEKKKNRKIGILGAGWKGHHSQRLTVPAANPGHTRMFTLFMENPLVQIKASELSLQQVPKGQGLPARERAARQGPLNPSVHLPFNCPRVFPAVTHQGFPHQKSKTCLLDILSLTMSDCLYFFTSPVLCSPLLFGLCLTTLLLPMVVTNHSCGHLPLAKLNCFPPGFICTPIFPPFTP